jgi:hypothetical protein
MTFDIGESVELRDYLRARGRSSLTCCGKLWIRWESAEKLKIVGIRDVPRGTLGFWGIGDSVFHVEHWGGTRERMFYVEHAGSMATRA